MIPDTVLLLVAKIAWFYCHIYNTEKFSLTTKLKSILDQKFNKPIAISAIINSNYQNKSLDYVMHTQWEKCQNCYKYSINREKTFRFLAKNSRKGSRLLHLATIKLVKQNVCKNSMKEIIYFSRFYSLHFVKSKMGNYENYSAIHCL